MSAPCPPAGDPLVALADRCVQCGLCLPVCPTYRHARLEAESPRGRIALTRAWALGTIPPSPAGDIHMDDCLACRACEAACPAGVRFGELLVATRARQRDRRGVGWRQRAIEALAARPRLLTALLHAYSRVASALPASWRPLPAVEPRLVGVDPVGAPHPTIEAPLQATPSDPTPTVALFVGCAARAYERPVREALARLGRAAGVVFHAPAGQGCCGALHAHAGNPRSASDLGSANTRAFAGSTTVATLASGCHASLAASLPPPTRAVDALELLAQRLPRLRFRPTLARVALHLPCTQRNVVGSVPALRRLLAAVPGLEVTELPGHGCCGASGSTMLTDPLRAGAYRAPLLAALDASGASLLLSANIGCRLHLAGGTPLPVRHPLEFLAERLDPATADAALDLDA